MREASGQASLMNIMLSIIGVIILLLAGSIAYSKAFRVKNRIIDIIERNNIYNYKAKDEIDVVLRDIGYRVNYLSTKDLCPIMNDYKLDTSSEYNYLYCVYKANDSTSDEYYYKVIAYMYFDIPFIGSYIRIPVSGETKILYGQNYDWKTVD